MRWIDVNGLGQLTQATHSDLSALIVQDTYGFPAPIPRDVVVIRDASHRVDLVRDRSGTAVTVTSFEHSKWLSAGRGGVAVAENAHVAGRLRDWRDDHRHEHRLLPIAAFTGVGILSGRLLFRGWRTLAPLGGWKVTGGSCFQAAIAACLIRSSSACWNSRHGLPRAVVRAIGSGSWGSSSASDGLTIRV